MTYFKNKRIVGLVLLTLSLVPAQARAGGNVTAAAKLADAKVLVRDDQNKVKNDALQIQQDQADNQSNKKWQTFAGWTSIASAACTVGAAVYEYLTMQTTTPEGFVLTKDPMLSSLPIIGCAAPGIYSTAEFFNLKNLVKEYPGVAISDLKRLHNDMMNLDLAQQRLRQLEPSGKTAQ